MSKKLVTTAQVEQIRKMAREKGVERSLFQDNLLDNGRMSRVLDEIKNMLPSIPTGLPITISGNQIFPPKNGRLCTVKVSVRLDRPWKELFISEAFHDPGNYNARNVGDLFLPTGTGVVEEELILLNYPKGDGSWKDSISWAEQCHLKRSGPRRVFAIYEGDKNFDKKLRRREETVRIAATEECLFQSSPYLYFIWWTSREVYPPNIDCPWSFERYDDWLAFRM